MSGKNLLVVESPAKAKTITKYLGKDFIVLSSRGHVRGIPSKSNAVDTEHNFETEYEINPASAKYIDAIADAAKTAQLIYMATDPDREGEAIAWHVVELLKQKKIQLENKLYRVTFNEVTPESVKAAIKAPRAIDMNLVSAQRARQSLDYLVGFSISPILWRKLPGCKSAGRVQSVALKVLCEREHEIIRFKQMDYWSITGNFQQGDQFLAELSMINNKKVEKFSFTSELGAKSVIAALKHLRYKVVSIEKKELQKNPEPPLITSTLIQAASTSLKMSSKKSMQIAQKLYEGIAIKDHTIGLITYMRTDSINISAEAVEKGRAIIHELYGDQYLPKEARLFKKKVKNAQEAHEAIRPTDPHLIPSEIKSFLTDDEFELYNLIWKRFIACQMSPAIMAKTTIKLGGIGILSLEIDESVSEFFKDTNLSAEFKVSGTMLLFDGFQKVLSAQKKDDDVMLPKIAEGDQLDLLDITFKQHTTIAPSRHSEATLVKKMESLGIGRPSTYATIISLLQERQYVSFNKNRFHVTDRGELVNTFLNIFFTQYVEYGFTAALEEELDDIASGEKDYLQTLKGFWGPFKINIDAIGQIQMSIILEKLQSVLDEFLFDDANKEKKCPKCKTGELKLRNSKYSPFIGCSNYPTCDFAQKFSLYNNKDDGGIKIEDLITPEDAPQMIHNGNIRIIGQDGEEQVMLNKGQYGHYISLCKNGLVQKNVNLPSFIDPENFNLEFNQIKKLFEMPFNIGVHQSNEVKVGIGRYGPYVLYKKKFYSIKIKDIVAVLNYSLDNAIVLLSGGK
jgi:DNA topoisomerase-1